MSRYAKKTDRRPYEERSFSVRAVHRDRADLHKLAEVLIRLTLQETGETRAAREAERGRCVLLGVVGREPVKVQCGQFPYEFRVVVPEWRHHRDGQTVGSP